MNQKQVQAIFQQHQHLIEQAVFSKQIRISGVTADDVFQETAIRLLNVIKSDRKIDNMPSYIYRTVANVIVDLARKNNKHSEHEFIAEPTDDNQAPQEWSIDEQTPDEQLSGEQLSQAIHEAIESLPESRRIAVKMRLQGYSIAEMAELTGWAYYKAENLSKRSMAALKEQLKKSGIDYEIN
jgi:RNA polymerase sigma factor (sigma-70 family)